MFSTILIANRGEIALRIIRTAREMGIRAIAVYSDADREARFVSEADEAFRIGPPPAAESYLNRTAIIEAALRSGAEAIHPGYGFLAENADFAEEVAAAGLVFIGPNPHSMRLMGDKIAARQTAVKAGVPVVPGSDGAIASVDEALDFVRVHGLPALVKAGGGGGGRGIRTVDTEDQLEQALQRASKEAETYFANPEVYLERYFEHARHVEVQVVGDSEGTVEVWGERDCSTQRRRQKLIEETPAPNMPEDDRAQLHQAAKALAQAARYVGVGTVEFLYAGPAQFFFLEMNTRVQVEHTITEEVTGLDLVRESIRMAAAESAVAPTKSRGHAIEARINAEDPGRAFAPGAGKLLTYREPGGPGVRLDSGVYQGFEIPSSYDSLIAKLIVHAPSRDAAIKRLLRALDEFVIEGVPTTIPLIRSIVESETFAGGRMTTDWLDANLSGLVGPPQPTSAPAEDQGPPRLVQLEINGKHFEVRLYDGQAQEKPHATRPRGGAERRTLAASSDSIVSPMHGTVMRVSKAEGDTVAAGEAVFVVEAMKMENEVPAPRDGVLAKVLVAVGETIDTNQLLAELERAG